MCLFEQYKTISTINKKRLGFFLYKANLFKIKYLTSAMPKNRNN